MVPADDFTMRLTFVLYVILTAGSMAALAIISLNRGHSELIAWTVGPAIGGGGSVLVYEIAKILAR